MQTNGKWLLLFGALGGLCGLAHEAGQTFYRLGYYIEAPESLVELGFEALYIACLLGLGLGWLGLGARFDEGVCRLVGWVKLALLADLYLFGFLSLLGGLGVYVGPIVFVLQLVALVQLVRKAQPRPLFLVAAVLFLLAYGLSWLVEAPSLRAALSFLSDAVYVILFGWVALRGADGGGVATTKGPQLLLAPSLTFSELRLHLASLNLVEEPGVMVTPSLIPGEPELARFRGSAGPVIYTFNPVVSLRVLDLSLTSNALFLAETLRTAGLTIGEADLRGSLQSPDARRRLLGILGAQALGLQSLGGAIVPLCHDPERAVAQAAESFVARFGAGGSPL